MPTYEYQCGACKHAFEQFQSMKDKALTKCPACGKAKLERLIGTGGAIIFKGGGFYQTDYRSESYKKAADADKPASTSSSDSGKADAKPAATSDTKVSAAESKPAAASTSNTKTDKPGSKKKAE